LFELRREIGHTDFVPQHTERITAVRRFGHIFIPEPDPVPPDAAEPVIGSDKDLCPWFQFPDHGHDLAFEDRFQPLLVQEHKGCCRDNGSADFLDTDMMERLIAEIPDDHIEPTVMVTNRLSGSEPVRLDLLDHGSDAEFILEGVLQQPVLSLTGGE